MEEKPTKKPRVISEATRQLNRERQAARRAAKPDENRENMKKWLAKPGNIERKNQMQKAYYEAHKETYAANRKRWSEANPEREREWHVQHHAKNPRLRPNLALKKKYGITLEDYERMEEAQGKRCFICSRDTPGGYGERFHVDHDHKTNKIRKLLCHYCNVSLGGFQDSPRLLRLAIAYLLAHGTPDDS